MKYLLIDSMNMFFRAKHVTSRQADSWSKVGFALQITMSSVNKAYRLTGADHVVFCFEGKSWRKEFFTPYKANRAAARAALSEREQEEDELFFEAYNDLVEFWQNETNCTTLQCSIAEADDLIARWIKLHPDDQHTIVSSDSDFYQLLAENVQQYNGIEKHMITLDGIYDDNNKPVIDKKTKEPKAPPEPKWTLFEKCMRGDTSDNVFSAYPGVRKKGTKNKVGLLDAFEDRDSKGYSWNNMMLQRWTDHNEKEHRVLDDYNRNVTLIDLDAQPQEVKDYVDQCINEQVATKHIPMVGAKFLKFCGKYELTKLSEFATTYAEWMNKVYNK